MAAQTIPNLSSLADDGDMLELDDGRTLRLLIQPDDVSPFDDVDVYGKLAQGRHDGNTGHPTRPQGFDGNAEILSLREGPVWWQPPADGPKRGTEAFTQFRRLVLDLCEFGYSVVTLELTQGLDAYGRPIVVKVASLGGVEPIPYGNPYLREIIGELASEIFSEEMS